MIPGLLGMALWLIGPRSGSAPGPLGTDTVLRRVVLTTSGSLPTQLMDVTIREGRIVNLTPSAIDGPSASRLTLFPLFVDLRDGPAPEGGGTVGGPSDYAVAWLGSRDSLLSRLTVRPKAGRPLEDPLDPTPLVVSLQGLRANAYPTSLLGVTAILREGLTLAGSCPPQARDTRGSRQEAISAVVEAMCTGRGLVIRVGGPLAAARMRRLAMALGHRVVDLRAPSRAGALETIAVVVTRQNPALSPSRGEPTTLFTTLGRTTVDRVLALAIADGWAPGEVLRAMTTTMDSLVGRPPSPLIAGATASFVIHEGYGTTNRVTVFVDGVLRDQYLFPSPEDVGNARRDTRSH